MDNLIDQLIKKARDAVLVIDEDGCILLWNEGAETIFGHAGGEMLGQPLTRVMPERFREAHLSGMERFEGIGDAGIFGKTVELTGLHKDGREFPMEATLDFWVEDEKTLFSAIFRDISERKAAEEKNQRRFETQEALRKLLETSLKPLSEQEQLHQALNIVLSVPWLSIESKGAVFLFHQNGGYLTLAAQKNLPEQLLSACKQVPLGKCLCGQAALSRLVVHSGHLDERHETTYEGIRSHGHYCVPILFQERLLGVLNTYVAHDHVRNPDEEAFLLAVSHTLAGLIERRLMETRLRKALSKAERANQVRRDFLATVSHEVRTPLNGILGMAEILMEKNLPGKKMFYVEMIKKSGESLLGVINDILDFSKIEAGKMAIEEADFDLREMRKDLRNLFGEIAEKKGIRFSTRIAKEVPQVVCGDIYRLRQILVNLLNNAIKFTNTGDVVFNVAAEQTEKIVWVRFLVQDTGIGIDQQNLGKLFQPFSQAETTSNIRPSGTGLGLSISKNLVELMGGEIEVESEVGKGSLFTVTLPLKWPSENKIFKRMDPPKRMVFSIPYRVLLVEDNLVSQRVCQIMLLNMGLQVKLANNGWEALKSLKKNVFDAVVMDCQMPEMDGYTACRVLREREQAGGNEDHTPVIALTAAAMKGDREHCLSVGMDDYLSKPIEKQKLFTALQRWIKKR